MVVVGDEGVVIVAVDGPLICTQVPVPMVGVFPVMVADPPVEQIVWSGPAFEAVGCPFTVMITWSEEGVQGEFEMVHRNVYAPGRFNPVIVVVGE